MGPGASSSDQGQDEVINSPDGSSGGSSSSTSTANDSVNRLQLGIDLASGFIGLISFAIGFCVWLHRRVSQLLLGVAVRYANSLNRPEAMCLWTTSSTLLEHFTIHKLKD